MKYKTTSKKGELTIKIDGSKVFDMVHWDYLLNVMAKFVPESVKY